jgi:hypothetical protein
MDQIRTVEMDAVVAAHHFSEERHWFSTTFHCVCGYSFKASHGICYGMAVGFGQADHWAALLGIRKWRTLENIQHGR